MRNTIQCNNRLLGWQQGRAGRRTDRTIHLYNRRRRILWGSFVWNSNERHTYLLGLQRVRANRNTDRAIYSHNRRNASYLRNTNQRHSNLLG